MAAAMQGFKVVTEFVFNADNAISSAEKLNSKIDKLSKTADEAVNSVFKLGASYAMSFSGATGGILGVLGSAIKSADKFKATQIELANSMTANSMTMNGGVLNFNDALIQSGHIMDGIIKKSRQLGISPDQFTSQVKFFNNMLAPKGLSGQNLERSTELARVSMKAAPALGVSEEQSISGIMSGISGQLSRNTQFGTRLFMEAGDAISEVTGGVITDLKSFNKASAKVRIDAMIAGLDKLAGTTKTIEARADTLTNRLRTIGDLFYGVGSILKPLGKVILPVIKDTLDMIVQFLKTDGAKIVKEVAKFIKGFIKHPKKMLEELMTLAKLSEDVGKSVAIAGLAVTLSHIKELNEVLGGFKMTAGLAKFNGKIGEFITNIPFAGKAIARLVNFMHKAFAINMGSFGTAIYSIGRAFLNVGAIFTAFLIPLQGLSKAIARAKIDSFTDGLSRLPQLAEWINTLKNAFMKMMAPVNDLIDGWADLFSVVVGGTMLTDILQYSLGRLVATAKLWGEEILALWSAFKSVFPAVLAFFSSLSDVIVGFLKSIADLSIKDIVSGNMLKHVPDQNPFMEYMKTFTKSFDESNNRFRTPTLGPNGEQGTVQNPNINNKFDVKMTNNFKEVLQPDRIAFTIEDQLKKSSENRSGGVSTSSARLGSAI